MESYFKSLYQFISSIVQAIKNCEEHSNSEWRLKHKLHLQKTVKNYLPSGAGLDNGTKFEEDLSTPEKLVFSVDFHHMNDNGCYDGWTHHRIIVTASLVHELNIRISGPNRNKIKDELHEIFYNALTEKKDWE